MLAVALAAVAACGGGTASSGVLTADVARVMPGPDAPVDEVVAGLEAFGLRAEAMLAAEGGDGAGNTVLSPASIGIAFAMAQGGARGDTEQRIAEVFGFPAQPGLHEAMNELTAQLDAVAGRGEGEAGSDGDEVVLDLADAVWLQRDFPFEDAYLDLLGRHYGAGLHTADFRSDPEAGRRAINAWVEDATRERIPELVPSGVITPDTRAALVNAIYLKAAWQEAFDEAATADADFHLADGTTVQVPMMHAPALDATAADGDGYVAVEVPYAGGELAMLVIVPDEGTDLDELRGRLGDTALADVARTLRPALVDLSLPRWETGAALDLGPVLTALGLPVPGGDLSGIGPDLSIGAAVHAADITVDESGTEAAAATAVIVEETAAPVVPDAVVVRADRPFLFAIRHTGTGAPLFVGRVADPRG